MLGAFFCKAEAYVGEASALPFLAYNQNQSHHQKN